MLDGAVHAVEEVIERVDAVMELVGRKHHVARRRAQPAVVGELHAALRGQDRQRAVELARLDARQVLAQRVGTRLLAGDEVLELAYDPDLVLGREEVTLEPLAQGTAGMGPASNTSSGSDPSSGATETNAVPAPCESNDMCPSGVQCVFPSGGGTLGFCDVSDTSGEPNDGSGSGASDGSDPSSATSGGASLATPAACNSDSDCPEGVACMKFDPAGPGFCDVNEMQAP
jgi:hypothetical protein